MWESCRQSQWFKTGQWPTFFVSFSGGQGQSSVVLYKQTKQKHDGIHSGNWVETVKPWKPLLLNMSLDVTCLWMSFLHFNLGDLSYLLLMSYCIFMPYLVCLGQNKRIRFFLMD